MSEDAGRGEAIERDVEQRVTFRARSIFFSKPRGKRGAASGLTREAKFIFSRHGVVVVVVGENREIDDVQ